jgi:hypothetical protein
MLGKILKLQVLLALGLAGCASRTPPTVAIPNPWLGGMLVAVAPAMNFSGSVDLDPYAIADLMASELSHVDGMDVLPVSRTLAVLAREDKTRIESAEHALRVRDMLGADAILVFAVTEFDPYEPPTVGLSAQLYGAQPGDAFSGLDPVRVSRSASALSQRPVVPLTAPLAQAARVYNGSHQPTVKAVKVFAEARSADGSAYGWRKYLVSQQHYLRFCCHATIKELVQHGVRRQVASNF